MGREDDIALSFWRASERFVRDATDAVDAGRMEFVDMLGRAAADECGGRVRLVDPEDRLIAVDGRVVLIADAGRELESLELELMLFARDGPAADAGGRGFFGVCAFVFAAELKVGRVSELVVKARFRGGDATTELVVAAACVGAWDDASITATFSSNTLKVTSLRHALPFPIFALAVESL